MSVYKENSATGMNGMNNSGSFCEEPEPDMTEIRPQEALGGQTANLTSGVQQCSVSREVLGAGAVGSAEGGDRRDEKLAAKSQYGSYAGGEGTSEKVVVGDPGGKDTIQIRQGGKKTPSHSLCSGEPLCLDQAIAYQIKAVELTPNDHAGRPMLPNNMGVSYMRRFERLGEFSDVEGGFLPRGRENWHRLDRAEGVVAVKQSITALKQLGQSLATRFQLWNHEEDMRNSIRCVQLAIYLISREDSNYPVLLSILAWSYISRFLFYHERMDVNKGIEYLSQVMQLIAGNITEKPDHLADLGTSYMLRFGSYGERGDLDKGIECYKQAILLTPNGYTDRPIWLSTLGVLYQSRFGNLGELADLNNMIECYSQAVLLTPDGHANMSGRLALLACSYRCRYNYRGETEITDLENATKYEDEALRVYHAHSKANKTRYFGNSGDPSLAKPPSQIQLACINSTSRWMGEAVRPRFSSDIDEPSHLASLGDMCLSRYELSGNPADISEGIECYNQVVQLTPDGHATKSIHLQQLGCLYDARFRRRSELVDADKAIQCHKQALGLISNYDMSKRECLRYLGVSYVGRFWCSGDTGDIENAIGYSSHAVQLTPEGHEELSDCLNELGISYLGRFEHRRELTDVEKGIECFTRAILLNPEGHIHMSCYLGNLGGAYIRRFERHGVPEDIDDAIKCLSRATQLTPVDSILKAGLLTGLGHSYLYRFQRRHGHADIDMAIKFTDAAVRLIPDGQGNKAASLTNLANSLRIRFQYYGDLMDINKAIECLTKATQLTPEGHPNKPILLLNLGDSYLTLFRHQDTSVHGDTAIRCLNKAVQLFADEGHAEMSSALMLQGEAYQARYQCQKNPSDLTKAATCFKEGAHCATGDPVPRLHAARQWANICRVLEISPLDAYQKAMELMPELVWLGLPINQRYIRLLKISGAPIEAASCAIKLKEYDRALEWLEQGRSVVWNQILQLRTPFDELIAVNPSLGKRLKEVAMELRCGGSPPVVMPLTTNAEINREKVSLQYRQMAAEWSQLLEQARRVPGFQGFMRPRKAAALMAAARDGPVIVVNVSSHCDALVILPNCNKIKHIALDSFSWEKAVDARTRLMRLIGCRGNRAGGFKHATPRNHSQPVKEMLGTLWVDVVKPILDFLGYMVKPPAHEMPHVTWCITGPLSFLPLHAAGCYNGSDPNTFDLVVSSYTPTLSALLNSRTPVLTSNSGLLTIGLQHTKGLGDLPNTVKELAAISKLAGEGRYMQLDGESATVDAVLNAMDQYSCVHLACHATQNPEDPSQSAFHLYDGRLKLSTIMGQSFKNKGLAFLSACQTATGCEQLADEAVHLAAGMLMAGYPSVIGTMWGILDDDAPEVANAVYTHLLKDGRMNCGEVARALHAAVAGLREKVGETAFERWAAFLHIGC